MHRIWQLPATPWGIPYRRSGSDSQLKGIAIISLDIQPPIKKYRLAYPNP